MRNPKLPTDGLGPNPETRPYDLGRALDDAEVYDELPGWVQERIWDAVVANYLKQTTNQTKTTE